MGEETEAQKDFLICPKSQSEVAGQRPQTKSILVQGQCSFYHWSLNPPPAPFSLYWDIRCAIKRGVSPIPCLHCPQEATYSKALTWLTAISSRRRAGTSYRARELWMTTPELREAVLQPVSLGCWEEVLRVARAVWEQWWWLETYNHSAHITQQTYPHGNPVGLELLSCFIEKKAKCIDIHELRDSRGQGLKVALPDSTPVGC